MRIFQIIQKGNIYICLIHETETQVMNEDIVKGIWGRYEMDWSEKGVEGQAGKYFSCVEPWCNYS